eukprot:a510044_173.p1 GENE.a510044_173~~a510044_173.p1  ORF type:complete len:302 (+),score=66.63 a510044_173:40-906(+)
MRKLRTLMVLTVFVAAALAAQPNPSTGPGQNQGKPNEDQGSGRPSSDDASAAHKFFEKLRTERLERHGDVLAHGATRQQICDSCLAFNDALRAYAMDRKAEAHFDKETLGALCESVPSSLHLLCHLIVERYSADLTLAVQRGDESAHTCAQLELCHGADAKTHGDEAFAAARLRDMASKLHEMRQRMIDGKSAHLATESQDLLRRYDEMNKLRHDLELNAATVRRYLPSQPHGSPEEMIKAKLQYLGLTPPGTDDIDALESALHAAVANRDTMWAKLEKEILAAKDEI